MKIHSKTHQIALFKFFIGACPRTPPDTALLNCCTMHLYMYNEMEECSLQHSSGNEMAFMITTSAV